MPVVPYIGTWIETVEQSDDDTVSLSYLIQVRGLKHQSIEQIGIKDVVPYIGTWIETTKMDYTFTLKESYLIQVRGLKPIYWNVESDGERSYLIQVRGLKLSVWN